MKRKKFSQTKHNSAVRRSAAGFVGQGFKVQADIARYPKPKTIGGYRPDVIAVKGNRKVITEWETPSSMKTDLAQRSAFRKHANARKNVSFRTKVAR